MNKTAKHWKEKFGTKARFVGFNIPQLRSFTGQTTCPYAGDCADVCYAGQGRMIWKNVVAPREDNLKVINELKNKKRQLADLLISDLEKKKTVTHVRIHDSGDFFAKWYYHAWVFVAEKLPNKIFYAYTKSIPFLQWDQHPDNFRVVQSEGGKRDHDIDRTKPHARIFASDEDRLALGYCDGNVDDIPAVVGENKIGLVYHGVKNLTEQDLVKLKVNR